jgi:hypothetical protein
LCSQTKPVNSGLSHFAAAGAAAYKKDIVRLVDARRIRWNGQVERMENSRMPKRVTREKIYTRRKRGRPKVRGLDDVQEDLREMRIEGWRRKAQNRDQWRRIAQEAKVHLGL